MLKVRVVKRRDGFMLDANFEAPTPGVVALFGRSGCGKTTTINIISGLLAADEARIELDGEALDAARRDEVLPYLERLRDHLSIPMVYVSHQFDEVLRLATHVVLMDAGRVLAQGALNEVSLVPALRDIVGADSVGAVLDGMV